MFFILLGLFALLHGFAMISISESNLISISFLRFTHKLKDENKLYPVWSQTEQASIFLLFDEYHNSDFLFWNDTDLIPNSWLAGRLAYAQNDFVVALEKFQYAYLKEPNNSILAVDLILTSQKLTTLDEMESLPHIPDTSLLNLPIQFFCVLGGNNLYVDRYWELTKNLLKENSLQAVKFKKMVNFWVNSFDLNILYNCWNLAHKRNISFLENTFAAKLEYFGKDGTYSSYKMREDDIRVIPALMEESLWDTEKAERLVSLLVWQQYDVAVVETILLNLQRDYPSSNQWRILLGELYQRRGDLDHAEYYFDSLVEVDPSSYLKLGLLEESRYMKTGNVNHLESAWERFEQYYELAPEDLYGLRTLEQLGTELKYPEADSLKQEFQNRIDIASGVAALLDVSVKQLTLGETILANGEFEKWTSTELPLAWRFVDYASGGPFDRGLFVNGKDNHCSWDGACMRIKGVWLERNDDDNVGLGNSGISPRQIGTRNLPVLPASDEPFVLSFFYKTKRAGLIIWIAEDEKLMFEGNYALPPTNGTWRQFILIGWNHTGRSKPFELLFRSFSVGDIWIDDIAINPIDCSSLPDCRPSYSRSMIR
jgi:tetratricopeptide (TPR) repeat protein